MAKHRAKPSSIPQRRGPTARRNLWLLLLFGVAIALAWLLWRPAKQPPNLELSGFDPAVKELILKARDQVAKAPRSAPAWGNLGLALQNYEHPREAQVCFQRAIELSRQDARWPFYLGMLALPTVQALPYFQEAARLAGTNNDIPHLRLGQTLGEHGRLAEAETVYSNLLSFQPTNAAARLALARLQLSHPDQAANTLQEALTDERTAHGAYELMAIIQQRLGNGPAADRARQIASSLPPDKRWPDSLASQAVQWRVGEQARVDHGQQLLSLGKTSDALQLAKGLITEYPGSSEGWLLLARARFENQDCSGAEAALRQHLRVTPISVNGYTQLGVSLLCQNRFEEAATAFEEALKLKPDLGQAQFNLGYTRAQQGDLTGAMRAFAQAIRCNPEFFEAYTALAELHAQTGNPAKAQELAQRAAELRPASKENQWGPRF